MRKGHFGPLVIGKEAFDQEQEDVAKGIDYFGPAVVGESKPQQPTPDQLKHQPGLAALHGIHAEPTIVVPPPTGESGAAIAPPVKENAQLSLEKLKDALDNAFSTDAYIEMEFARAEGPRKGALRLLIEAERKNVVHGPDGDTLVRPAMLARLEAALKPVPVPA